MAPVLREIYARSAEPRTDLESLALRRLNELAPDEGREIILAEIRRPTRHLRYGTLAVLPDESLPQDESFLADQIEHGEGNEALILRYATGSIVQRVKNV